MNETKRNTSVIYVRDDCVMFALEIGALPSHNFVVQLLSPFRYVSINVTINDEINDVL